MTKNWLTSIANAPLPYTRKKESHQILEKVSVKSIAFPWKAHLEVLVQLVHGYAISAILIIIKMSLRRFGFILRTLIYSVQSFSKLAMWFVLRVG